MTYDVQCPSCRVVMRSKTPIPGGKRVKCLKCQVRFVTPATQVRQETDLQPKAVRPAAAPAKKKPVEPEYVVPEIVEPDVVEPEIVEPEIVEPEVVTPDVVEPTVVDDHVRPTGRHKRGRATPASRVMEPIIEDEDDGELDDEPRRAKKKKKRRKSGNNKGLLIGLIGGGACLVLIGVVVGAILFFGGSGSSLVGKWRVAELSGTALPADAEAYFEFKSDGTLTVSQTALGRTREESAKYTVSGDTITVEGGDRRTVGFMPRSAQRLQFAVKGNELTLSDNLVTMKLRRV